MKMKRSGSLSEIPHVRTLGTCRLSQKPEVDVAVETETISHLTRVFQKYQQCLRTVNKPPKWKPNEPVEQLTDEEKEQKKKFRSWLAIGCNSVVRALEGNKCKLVLMSQTTQPADLKRAVLSLVVSRQCPAICLSDLQTPLKALWPGLTSLTALGILKTDEPNAFDSMVDYVSSAVPLIDIPGIPKLGEQSQRCRASTEKQEVSKCGQEPVNIQSQNTVTEVQAVNQSKMETDATAVEKVSIPSMSKTGNYAKYYIYVNDKIDRKAFEGQDYIGFGVESASSSYLEADMRYSHESSNCLGITPSLICSDEGMGDAGIKVKRKRKTSEKQSGSSSYGRINVKQLKKRNSEKKNKKGKKKKKMKAINT